MNNQTVSCSSTAEKKLFEEKLTIKLLKVTQSPLCKMQVTQRSQTQTSGNVISHICISAHLHMKMNVCCLNCTMGRSSKGWCLCSCKELWEAGWGLTLYNVFEWERNRSGEKEWPAERVSHCQQQHYEEFWEKEQQWGWKVDPTIRLLENNFTRWIRADRQARHKS